MKIYILFIFLMFFCGNILGQSRTLFKTEAVCNDSVVWFTSNYSKSIIVYLKNNKSKLNHCVKIGKLKNAEMIEYNINKYLRSEDTKECMNLLLDLFVENLTTESKARLQKITEKRPVNFHITVDSSGKILNIELTIKTEKKDILTSKEVYDICKLIQERIQFNAPSTHELDCVTFSFPIKRKNLM